LVDVLVRQTTAANFVDVLDHVVDKGIVIDAWVALWGAGISLVPKGDARIKIASVETYLPAAPLVVRTFRSARSSP
jgi:gas vesicle structural protein